MKKQIFDYSKYSERDYTYYGFHLKNGRYHIDTKRLAKLGGKPHFPEGLFSKPRNTHYFVPRHKSSADYAINILKEQLNTLRQDWAKEYKVVISKLTTPKEVQDEFRANSIAYTTDVDDLDNIEFESLREGLRREKKYDQVIKSIHLQYLQKIFTELFRAILIVIKDRGYTNADDFSYLSFLYYVQNRFNTKKEMNPIYKLPHYKYFEALNKIDNFLKHNTVMAYQALANNSYEKDEEMKKFLSSFVYSEKEAGCRYENGVYAGNWLKIGPTFVDDMLDNLYEFVKEFCKLLYDEDDNEASWNSDDALIQILRDNYINFM